MTNAIGEQIEVLNGLVLTTLDSADGYGEAAKVARNQNFKRLFGLRAVRRRQLTVVLQDEIRNLGGEPKEDGSILAAGHRIFLNLKNVVAGSDEGVINEVESGEDYIKGKYEAALREGNLSASIKAIVADAYERIKADYHDIRDIKDDFAVLSESGADASL
jgi:uncharacterized protein (TIGR02284 family)